MASSTSFSSDVVAYREQLRYYALSLTSNLEEANDLVQETMLKAFTHESRFQPDTNLKAWLYTILRNIFINNYRRSIKFRSIVDLGTDIGQAELPQSSKDAFNPEVRIPVQGNLFRNGCIARRFPDSPQNVL